MDIRRVLEAVSIPVSTAIILGLGSYIIKTFLATRRVIACRILSTNITSGLAVLENVFVKEQLGSSVDVSEIIERPVWMLTYKIVNRSGKVSEEVTASIVLQDAKVLNYELQPQTTNYKSTATLNADGNTLDVVFPFINKDDKVEVLIVARGWTDSCKMKILSKGVRGRILRLPDEYTLYKQVVFILPGVLGLYILSQIYSIFSVLPRNFALALGSRPTSYLIGPLWWSILVLICMLIVTVLIIRKLNRVPSWSDD